MSFLQRALLVVGIAVLVVWFFLSEKQQTAPLSQEHESFHVDRNEPRRSPSDSRLQIAKQEKSQESPKRTAEIIFVDDDSGRLISNVHVYLQADSYSMAAVLVGKSGADGRVVLNNYPFPISVFADHTMHTPMEWVINEQRSVVRMSSGTSVTGTVYLKDNRTPVEGIQLSARQLFADGQDDYLGTLLASRRLGMVKTTRSKEDGSFVVHGLPTGALFDLRVLTPGFCSPMGVSQGLVRAGDTDIVVIANPFFLATVSVFDKTSGDPITWFSYQKSMPSDIGSLYRMSRGELSNPGNHGAPSRSLDDNQIQVSGLITHLDDVSESSVSVSISAPGYESRQIKIPIRVSKDKASRHRVDLSPKSPMGFLRPSFVWPSGDSFAERSAGWVFVHGAGAQRSILRFVSNPKSRVWSQAALPIGSYSYVDRDGTHQFEIIEDTETTCVIHGGFQGKVNVKPSFSSGAPGPFYFRCRGPLDAPLIDVSGRTGRDRFSEYRQSIGNLTPGTYRITISKPGYEVWENTVDVNDLAPTNLAPVLQRQLR